MEENKGVDIVIKSWAVILIVMLLAGGAAGCAKEPQAKIDTAVKNEAQSQEIAKEKQGESLPESYLITVKNRIDYQSGSECAAFASAYLLRHYGEEAGGIELFKTFPGKVSDGGVSPYGIETFFNGQGYKAEFKCNGTVEELKKEVSKGAPVIVFIHVKEPYESTHYTHYLPLVGYDQDYLYFAESLPEFANCKNEEIIAYNRKTDIAKFKRLWLNIDGMWNYPYFVITKKQSNDQV